ncbi:cellulose-binding domain-containing protein, partial [Micromonospora sp. R42004]
TSTPPTSTPPTSTPPTSTPPTSPPPTTPNPAGGCTATYAITGSWGGGFQADVKVTNNSGSPIRGWSVSWNYQNGQQVSSAWNATVTTSGTLVTARNAAYNGSLAPGASTSFGFTGSAGATNPVPSIVSCTTTA